MRPAAFAAFWAASIRGGIDGDEEAFCPALLMAKPAGYVVTPSLLRAPLAT
jgi:hypothetical protein